MPGFGGLRINGMGFEEQIRLIQAFPRIAEPHIRQSLQESIALTETSWQGVAPEATGEYRGSIAGRIRRIAGFKGTAYVEAKAGGSGFPYPRNLESSERYHYRSTSRRGQRTKGQVRKMFRGIKTEITRKFERALQRTLEALVVRTR